MSRPEATRRSAHEVSLGQGSITEVARLEHRTVGQQLGRRALKDDLTVVQDVATVRHFERQVDVLLDDDRCETEADVTFGVGPAGTGKTYLAMAMAVSALREEKVSPRCRPLARWRTPCSTPSTGATTVAGARG